MVGRVPYVAFHFVCVVFLYAGSFPIGQHFQCSWFSFLFVYIILHFAETRSSGHLLLMTNRQLAWGVVVLSDRRLPWSQGWAICLFVSLVLALPTCPVVGVVEAMGYVCNMLVLDALLF